MLNVIGLKGCTLCTVWLGDCRNVLSPFCPGWQVSSNRLTSLPDQTPVNLDRPSTALFEQGKNYRSEAAPGIEK